MKKVLIATHGYLADGFKSSIHVLAGDKYEIQTINAYTDEQCQDYSSYITDFIKSVTAEDEGVIFTDLLSGSVNQKVCQLSIEKTSHIHIITGMNLMCLLAVLLESRPLNKLVLKEIIDNSKVSLVELNIEKTEDNADEEQDFLS